MEGERERRNDIITYNFKVERKSENKKELESGGAKKCKVPNRQYKCFQKFNIIFLC